MSDLNVNVDDIKEPEVVAPGIYQGATIEALDFALVDKDSGNEEENHKRDKNGDRFLQGRFKIVEGPFAGQSVFANYITIKDIKGGILSLKKLAESAGLGGVVGRTEDLVGLPLRGIKVDNELYEGKLKATIKDFV